MFGFIDQIWVEECSDPSLRSENTDVNQMQTLFGLLNSIKVARNSIMAEIAKN